MLSYSRLIWVTLFLLGIFFTIGVVTSASTDASFVYGYPPLAGNIVLNFNNSENDLDAVAIVTLGGHVDPLYAIYIPAGEIGSIKNIGQGRYDIYFQLGIDWDEPNRLFQDGTFWKMKTPLIMNNNKDTYTVYLYDQKDKPSRIKEISKKELPDIAPRV